MPAGHPSNIETPIEIPGPNNTTRTVTRPERITEFVRSGLYFELACKAAGVPKTTGYEWRKTAGLLRIRAYGRTLEQVDATPHELACLRFADAVEAAEAEAAATNNLIAQGLIRGGRQLTKTVTRIKTDADGNVVERETVTTTEETMPDGAMIRWWFERRFPELYGRKVEIVDGVPPSDEERSEALSDALENWLKTPEARELADESAAVVSGGNGKKPKTARAAPRKRTRRMRDARGKIVGEIDDNGAES